MSGTITVTVNAADDTAIDRVEFSVDAGAATTDTTAPYEFDLDTTVLTGGAHTITATAFDTTGNNTSHAIDVTVNNPPTIAITSHSDGDRVNGTITVTANAADDTAAIDRVEFSIDGGAPTSDTTDPYEFDLDTTVLAGGAHTITATAFDTTGANVSTLVTVLVDNPPTIAITSPAPDATISGTTIVTATASDDNEVDRVEFSIDGGAPTSDTTDPYEFDLDTTILTGGAHTITATAFDTTGNNTSHAIDVIIAPTVKALYAAAPNWNDYVKTADTTTACDGTETGGYSACIHGGERRSVEVRVT